MRITLITPTPPDISAFGVRILSSYLRQHGKDVRIIFLPGSLGSLREKGDFAYSYDKKVIDKIIELSSDSDIIGLSFMTNYYDRALQITKSLKRNLGAPVIWGGIHPSTADPEESLKYADIVCFGDGEEALLELSEKIERKEDFYNIKGLWLNKGNKIIKNEMRRPLEDLDSLPFFDFSLKEHYIYDRITGSIIPLDVETFKNILPRLPHPDNKLKITYRTMTDRGCPHKCAYCNVSGLKEMYGAVGSKYFRIRSVEHSIAELVEIKNMFHFIEAIQFFDDTFFARPHQEIEEFSKAYKDKVGLPFYCQGSPNTITEKKMEYLVTAGMVYVEMGIQTGSERIKHLYNRNESNEKIISATELIARYIPGILPPDYHVILDNPWETQEDVMDTVKLLTRIPKPFGLCISSLVFFPQTPLYVKAKQEGLIRDEVSDIYRRPFYLPPKKTYPDFLIYLLTFQHFPKFILKFLTNEGVVKAISRVNPLFLYHIGYKVGEAIRFIFKGIKVISCGDWERLRLYLNKIREKDRLVEGRKS